MSERIALIVITDGRLVYLERAMESARHNLPMRTFTDLLMVNDEPEAHRYLVDAYPNFRVVSHPTRRGLAASVNTAWEEVKPTDYIFHLEDDFVFNRPPELQRMMHRLAARPWLAQMVLKRQPWNIEEIAAGGIIERNPHAYQDHGRWVEHREIFSLNPCLYPASITAHGWPTSNEAGFTEACLGAGMSFGMWGKRDDPPAVTHIGNVRSRAWQL